MYKIIYTEVFINYIINICKVIIYCVHTSNRTLPATRGTWCAFSKRYAWFGFSCFLFLLHVPHQAIRCDLCMLTDYCSYPVSFSTTLPSSRGNEATWNSFRGISLFRSTALKLLFYQQKNWRSHKLTKRPVYIFSVPTVHHIAMTDENPLLIQLKILNSVKKWHPIAQRQLLSVFESNNDEPVQEIHWSVFTSRVKYAVEVILKNLTEENKMLWIHSLVRIKLNVKLHGFRLTLNNV